MGVCNAQTGECDHFEVSKNIFSIPPFIWGWSSIEFIPGTAYYRAVDNWDGYKDQRQFCITVVICGDGCRGGNCANSETYCNCDECRYKCSFGDIVAFEYQPSDQSFLLTEELRDNIFYCSEFVKGYESSKVYMGFAIANYSKCNNETLDVNVVLSNGTILDVDANADGSFIIEIFRGYYPFTLSTDGLENLDLLCTQPETSSYEYAWQVWVDTSNSNNFVAVTNWKRNGTNPTINPSTFFVNKLGVLNPGSYALPILRTLNGQPTKSAFYVLMIMEILLTAVFQAIKL